MPPENPLAAHHYHFAELESTQRYLLAHPAAARPVFCRADRQSAGYGQRGAPWQSPDGGLYFSLRAPLPMPPASHGGLTQQIALTLAQTIDPDARQLRLKWPNDLYLDTGKLGGILVDMLPDGDNCHVIIGIGINLRRRHETAAGSACYDDCYADPPDTLYPRLCRALTDMLDAWAKRPYLPVNHRWNAYDRYHGRSVTLENRPHPATVLGIDQKGRLTVRENGVIHYHTRTRIRG